MQPSTTSTLTAQASPQPVARHLAAALLAGKNFAPSRPWEQVPLVTSLVQLLTVEPSLRRTYAHARRLLRGQPGDAKVVEAANLFRIRGLPDEAAAILLHFGLFEQAAKTMLHHNLPERAAQIYAQASQWERAAFCFGQAGLWQKAAESCVGGRDFATAADYYARAGLLPEAAQCCIKAGDMGGAFRFYGLLGELDNAAVVLKQWRLYERDDSIQSKLTDADREMLDKISAGDSTVAHHQGGIKDMASVQAARGAAKPSPVDAAAASGQRFVASQLNAATTQPVAPTAQPSQSREVLKQVAQIPTDPSLMTNPGVVMMDGGLDLGGDGEYRPSWLDSPTMIAPLAGGKLDVADFFQHFSRADRDKLWQLGQVIDCAEGEVIVDFDDEPPGLYTVLDGHLAIYKDRGQGQPPVDHIGARVSLGQFWAVMRLKSHVRVTAAKACKVHLISRDALVKALRRNDATHLGLRQTFMAVLLQHLQSSILIKNM